MPQTFFVVKKALAANLPILVVINKIDKPAARCDWAVDQVFDLLARLGAPDHILDFPVVYASAKAGFALMDPSEPVTPQTGMRAVSEMIVNHVPPPAGSPDAPLQLQINTIDYSPYLGRLGIGRIVNGCLDLRTSLAVARLDGSIAPVRINKIFAYRGDQKVPVDCASTGEIVAIIETLQARANRAKSVTGQSCEMIRQCVSQSERTSVGIRQIEEAVAQIADMAIQIASACGEQDAVSDELGRNVARINDSSNEVATGADHTAKACLELSQLAAGLRQSMGRFRLA